jgi:methyltransferase (TIGR00027 family)
VIDDGPSSTALQVAAARAAHIRFDSPPHLLEDSLAVDLLGAEATEMIDRYGDDGPWILIENRLFIPLRARYVEDRLRLAHARGVRQFVILGAGLDSFAFRQPPDLDGLRIFEVDHPSMQQWKRDRLEALGWAIPDNVHYVPCDFEKHRVSEVLRPALFEPSQPAVVSWMGVVYYLEKATVESSLRDLSSILAQGSEVVFDMMRPWDELPRRYEEVRIAMSEYLSGAGEPQINRYRRDEIVHVVANAGFTSSLIEDREDITTRYLTPIGTQIPLSERFRLVIARAL